MQITMQQIETRFYKRTLQKEIEDSGWASVLLVERKGYQNDK